jgi:thiol-disulfide isomerase/thioredoxin
MLLLCATTSLAAWDAGTVLPDLTKFKLEGSLPTLAGKVVLVDFWASWCSPCKASFPALDLLQKDYGAKGFLILAVNQDKTGEAMKTFLAKNPVGFTTLRDPENKLVAAADVSSMPSSYLVDRSGRIRYIHRGFHGEKTLAQYKKEIELLLAETPGGAK